KISGILNDHGVSSFADLAAAKADQIKEWLTEAGNQYNRADPTTWPEQAALAAKGDWDALEKLQDELDGGVRK
ncbi:MAG: 50S ribosomal protein L17, partial [Gammaproteobacteria bacterium]